MESFITVHYETTGITFQNRGSDSLLGFEEGHPHSKNHIKHLRGVIRKFAGKCYEIALLLSIGMKVHRYKLLCDVRRMSTRHRSDVTLLEPAHMYPWVASRG